MKQGIWSKVKRDHQLLIILLPGALFFLIYRYGPMFGLITAFQKYSPFLKVLKSPMADNYGFEHFIKLFTSSDFVMLFRNTFLLGLFNLLWSFPMTVIFALMLNEIRVSFLKRTFQTISYFPTFLSIVIICSMAIDFLSPHNGFINKALSLFGVAPKYFISDPLWYRTIYVATEVWANIGSGAIIYLAALAGIDIALYEAARIDGAGRLRMIWNITLPSILPTLVTMLLLNSSQMFRITADKTLLLYNPFTYEVADIFSTYVYRRGILDMNYSYASAVGLFESVISLVILISFNKLSKTATGESLW